VIGVRRMAATSRSLDSMWDGVSLAPDRDLAGVKKCRLSTSKRMVIILEMQD
jgi:hypothetical protein